MSEFTAASWKRGTLALAAQIKMAAEVAQATWVSNVQARDLGMLLGRWGSSSGDHRCRPSVHATAWLSAYLAQH